ncbi:hypothetical protein CB1_000216049 [Camelus ferus]|nr:hypothetical protein CB1_000216049 [Camelus ferus]
MCAHPTRGDEGFPRMPTRCQSGQGSAAALEGPSIPLAQRTALFWFRPPSPPRAPCSALTVDAHCVCAGPAKVKSKKHRSRRTMNGRTELLRASLQPHTRDTRDPEGLQSGQQRHVLAFGTCVANCGLKRMLISQINNVTLFRTLRVKAKFHRCHREHSRTSDHGRSQGLSEVTI